MLIPVEHTKSGTAGSTVPAPSMFCDNRSDERKPCRALAWFATLADSNLAIWVTSLTEGKLDSLREERRGQLLSLLLCRLSKAHAWSATVLVNELNAGGL